MATALEVIIPGLPPVSGGRPKVSLTRDGGPTVTLPIADPRIEAADLAADWRELDRAGDRPYLGLAALKLDTRKLAAIVDEDVAARMVWGWAPNEVLPDYPGTVAEVILDQLRQLASPGPPVRVAFGSSLAGLWRIIDLSYNTTLLAPTDNHILRAEVAITVKRANDPPAVSRAPAAPPPPPPSPPPPQTATATGKTYTVRRGDSLWSIAQKVYGNGNHWQAIASANGIRDPRRLAVGQVLRLP